MLWIPDSLYWVPDSLSVGLRIPIVRRIWTRWTVFLIQQPRNLGSTTKIFQILDSTSKIVPYSRMRNPLHGRHISDRFFFRVRAIRYPLLNEHSLIKIVKTIKIAGVVHANWYLCKVHHYSTGCLRFTQVKIVIFDLIIPIINNFCALDAIVSFWTLTFPLERFKVGQIFSLILGLHADIVVLKYVAVC